MAALFFPLAGKSSRLHAAELFIPLRAEIRYAGRTPMSQTTERFELQTRLAVGNAGLVYRAVEKATRRRVALKLLSDELPHPLDGAALARDAARVRRTAGNNIAQFLEVLEDPEAGVVLVCEFADGPAWTVAAVEKKIDAAQAVDVAAQVLAALAVGEAIKVPHGEIKPNNLVLGELPGGRLFVWVLDWGLSAFRREPPPDALPWMAPERLAGGAASIAADLFSAGACLCWLLTGKVPVAGKSREELTAAWSRFPPDALRQVRPDLPLKFTRWIATLLEANPAARFASVAQARTALAALQPPAPPVLPEIFRPRPKAPASTISAPRPSAVAVAKVVAVSTVKAAPVPRVVATSAEVAPVPVEEKIAPIARPRSPWLWAGLGVAGTLALLAAAAFFFHRACAPAPPISTADAPPISTPAESPPTGVLAAERFDYPAEKRLDGQRGGRGFAGPWHAPQTLLRAASLSAGHPAPSGTGGHAAAVGAEEIVLRRTLGPRALFLDEAQGGTWWVSFVVAHFAPPGKAPGGDFRCNFFSEKEVHQIIRLKLGANGSDAALGTSTAHFPGAADEPRRLLLRIRAAPAAAGKFHVTMDLWVNPDAAKFRAAPPAAALKTEVKNAALPTTLGVLFQKNKAPAPTTTLLDDLRLTRTAQEALD